jgi:hypothetical protein
VQPANLKEQPQRTPRPLPPDQDQRHRQEVRADDLHSRLVAGMLRGQQLQKMLAHFTKLLKQRREAIGVQIVSYFRE